MYINKIAKMAKLLICTTIVTIVFAACGGQADTPPATPGTTPGTDAAEPVTPPPATEGHDPRAYQPVPAGGWDVPFPEPVHITAVSTQGVNWHFADGDDIHNNPWTRLYRDQLNVHVSFNWLAIDDYETRLNMSIAANDLPDVFFIPVTIPRTFHQLQAAGSLLDLTHAYQNYTSNRIRGFEEIDPYTIQVYTVDGRIYGIPRYYYGQIDQPWHLWVRKDWYEQAGSPEIRTVADLENLARTFIQTHGGYGISTSYTLQWLFRTAPMFGAYIGEVHDNQYFWRPDETGRLRPGIAFPEFMTALEHWQSWFAEGILSPDFATMTDTRAHEDVVNGLVGIQPWWQWWGWMNGPTIVGLQDNNDAYFVPLNLPTVAGDRPARGQIFFPNREVLVANSNFQNPGAWMKILSLVDHMIFSPDANLSQDELAYFMHEGREHGMGPNFKIIDPHADLLQMIHVSEALDTGDTSRLFTTGMQFKYGDSVAWMTEQSPHGLGAFLQMGFPGSAYARSQHLFDNDWIVQSALWGIPPEEFDMAGSTGDIILEEVVHIIMGINPVSHFETVLQQWYAQGGQIKEDAINLHFGN